MAALMLLLVAGLAGHAQDAGNLAATAAARIESGDAAGAAAELRAALREQPRQALLWNLMGIAESELGRAAEAEKAFRRGLAVDASHLPLNENLALLLFRGGRMAEARAALDRAVELGSRNPMVHLGAAVTRGRAGDPVGALERMRALETVFEASAPYWAERGHFELAAGRAGDAGASYERARKLAPRNVAVLNGVAAAAEAEGDLDKAVSVLVYARQVDGNDVATLVHLGEVCLRKDLAPDALEVLERAHALAPASNAALYLVAAANLANEKWERSYEMLSEYVKRVPGFATAWYSLGWLDRKLNRPEQARANFEKALALLPGHFEAEQEIAQLDLEENKIEAAQKRLQSVLSKKPNHAAAHVTMGDLLLRKGELDGAEQHYERAIAADPNLGNAHYKLATVLARKKEHARAQEARRVAAELNKAATDARRRQMRIVVPPDFKVWEQ